MSASNLCRKHGITDATFCNCRRKYGGMEVADAKRLKALEAESTKFKKMLAEQMLDVATLKEMLGKNSEARFDEKSHIQGQACMLGGTLIMTPLNAADGQIYAVAQGSVIAGGASAEGDAGSVTQGVPTSGVIPSGARVEREIDFTFANVGTMRLALRDPDFTTAARIERAINQGLGRAVAQMLDSGTVQLDLGTSGLPPLPRLISLIENIEVAPAQKARVVVDQRSGTIVLGADVRISRVAVSQGNLTLRVSEEPLAVQPNPFAPNGAPIILPRTQAEIDEEPGTRLALVEDSVNLPQVIEGLNALGVSPRDMIDILKAIKAAGALHAEFVVQ